MAKANRHPKKEIQEAIEVALKAGWRLEVGGSLAGGNCTALWQQGKATLSESYQHQETR